MNKVIIAAITISLLLTGLYLFKYQKNNIVLETPKDVIVTTTPHSSPTPKPVTNDDSFSSIETDLNNTVILEEDFSDIK